MKSLGAKFHCSFNPSVPYGDGGGPTKTISKANNSYGCWYTLLRPNQIAALSLILSLFVFFILSHEAKKNIETSNKRRLRISRPILDATDRPSNQHTEIDLDSFIMYKVYITFFWPKPRRVGGRLCFRILRSTKLRLAKIYSLSCLSDYNPDNFPRYKIYEKKGM